MIRAGIVCGICNATEKLIKLLLLHPDVELIWVQDLHDAGMRLDALYGTLVGDTTMLTTDNAGDLAATDVVFLAASDSEAEQWLNDHELPDTLRVVDMSTPHREDWVYGLSEVNRKHMVHDCRRVTCPTPVAMAAGLALLPLAKNLMLNSSLQVVVATKSLCTMPQLKLSDAEKDKETRQEVERMLQDLQASFEASFEAWTTIEAAGTTCVLATVTLACNVQIDLLTELYRQYYDDHRFVHVITGELSQCYVMNTNKCLINIQPTGRRVQVSAIIDGDVKGLAGNAVHVMNLLFGLHEQVGLRF